MRRPDNPPAFPNFAQDYGPLQEGMRLRDYIAVHALAGLLANPNVWANSTSSALSQTPDGIAGRAYEIADAMLAQRERQP